MLIGDARIQYLDRIDRLRGTKTVEQAFAAWLLGSEYVGRLELEASAEESANKSGAERSYKDVAILGYAVALLPESGQLRQALIDGLNWLCGRKPFPQSGVSFETDGMALLGLAVGADALGITDVSAWIASFLQRSASSRVTAMDRACIAATGAVTDNSHFAPMPTNRKFASCRLAFNSRGLSVTTAPDDDANALQHILCSRPSDMQEGECAVYVRVLDWLTKNVCDISLPHPSTVDLTRILERVSSALKRWRWDADPVRGKPPTRWPIDNEYHVQDLLWVILAPIFPDLEDEENLPSLGHKHPRYDLGIPSLHVIVEVKFIRRKSDFAKVTEEIAADHTLYLREGSSYNKIIAFIWDDSASTDQHAELKQAFDKMPGIEASVILSRPARMNEE